jgi:MerR family transcriptional regulator, heat shock protein HspR
MVDNLKKNSTKGKKKGDDPLYTIGVVSRLLSCEPSALRRYEDAGLVVPCRTEGNTRLYSDNDLETLREIHRLIDEVKLNARGARMVIELRKEVHELQIKIFELETRLKSLQEPEVG